MLRLLGFISLAITAIAVFIAFASGFKDPWAAILGIAWCLAWTVFWFSLAIRAQRNAEFNRSYLMSLPCGHCGSTSSTGYRVCGNCGRVKRPGL